MMNVVAAWTEKILIPTYGIGKPEKNPIFWEKRVYQGSSGVVYPYPVIEKIEDEKSDKEYEAVFIENEYLKIMILPGLGGRVHRAYDKIRNRDFIYYNQVIKPALVGLVGPWISGGIEFNWPQHHRPSTFEPIDFFIEENVDGSKTVWVNEVERMFGNKGMAGFTLYPGKAYLEIKVRLYNRTSFPQTFLWWANPAVKVNDHYQSVFPPDVHAVYDHGKRDVSDFPIATGTYYKVNYAPGTDISMYKNIPVPTSYMAVQSKYDFIGCYEHDTKAGMLHVANHHISTGKKQWTWGNGDFGKAWDKNLTDDDGPYIEIMCGAFTDNQPDFSWMQSHEQKSFEQYFMPFAGIGIVKNATKDAAINVDVTNKEITVQLYATSVFKQAVIKILHNDVVVSHAEVDIDPSVFITKKFPVNHGNLPAYYKIVVSDINGKELVCFDTKPEPAKELPPAAKAALKPHEIHSNEILYLTGMHLEQYRHATFSPLPYYEEAIHRDPGDARSNNALGLWYLKRGQFKKAEPYLRKAIARLTEFNPNPYDGEAFYNLGLCLKMQNQLHEAYDFFYKATWNDAQQQSSYFQLARIASIWNKYEEALELISKSIVKNYHSHSARHLKVALFRKTGKIEEANKLVEESLILDRFNFGCLFEQYLIAKNSNSGQLQLFYDAFIKIVRDNFNNYLEYAIDYMQAGMYEEAIQLLSIFEKEYGKGHPMLNYYLGWLYHYSDNEKLAVEYLFNAARCIPDYCFPNKLEDKMVLQFAVRINPLDSKAFYYLGNYWYGNRQYQEAIDCWQKSVELDPNFPAAHRNLSLACHNKLEDDNRSLELLDRAFFLDPTNARILMELDQLHKIKNSDPLKRLAFLQEYFELVQQRDDLYLEMVTLYNQSGNYLKAQNLIQNRKFHPWEGGEGKVVLQFLTCNIELVKTSLMEGDAQKALQMLENIKIYPDNLGEGKLYGTQENDIHYLLGCAYEALGKKENALKAFDSATSGISQPVQAIFYNDPQPDKIFYQGLAWLKLNQEHKANEIFHSLISFGKEHMQDKIEIDYFAVSLPDLLVFDQDLNVKNKIHCHYLIGLGHLGLGDSTTCRSHFKKVLEYNINHMGAIIHINMIDFLDKISKPV